MEGRIDRREEALAFLREVYQGTLFDHSGRAGRFFQQSSDLIPFQQQSQPENATPEEQRELEFLEAHEIRNPVILAYLE